MGKELRCGFGVRARQRSVAIQHPQQITLPWRWLSDTNYLSGPDIPRPSELRAAMATSVASVSSVRDRSPSPITRLYQPIDASSSPCSLWIFPKPSGRAWRFPRGIDRAVSEPFRLKRLESPWNAAADNCGIWVMGGKPPRRYSPASFSPTFLSCRL
jgi:hypothetical protein